MEESNRSLDDMIRQYTAPVEQHEVVALLRRVQGLYGYIPREARERITEKLKVHPSVLTVLIKRVPDLKEKAFLHEVVVCLGPRCGAKGSAGLLRAVERELGVSPGRVTTDGKFLLTVRNCLKQCGSSPNMRIDETLYPAVTESEITKIFEKYR